jgi:hypothetical protein
MGCRSVICVLVILYVVESATSVASSAILSLLCSFEFSSFIKLCWLLGFPEAAAYVVNLVRRGLLGAGLGCTWLSVPPLFGGFGIL